MLVRIIRIMVLSLWAGWLVGCGWLLHGPKQEISIATINDKMPEKTRCVLQNEEGLWKVMPTTFTIIKRDGNPLAVQCVNTAQTGENYVAAVFKEGTLALDGINLVAILVDAYYNCFYEYPPFVTVMMKDKKTIEFIDPLLQRGNANH